MVKNKPMAWMSKMNGSDYVRKSSLKFATWCSASFISPDDGLIMTNHHCSRDVVPALQKAGENFDKNGFYAETPADERRAEGLFVEQMIKDEDITRLVEEKVVKCNPTDDLATMKNKSIGRDKRAIF